MVIRDYLDSDYENVRDNLEQGKIFDPVVDTKEKLLKKITQNPGSIIIMEENNQAIGNVFTVDDGWAAFIFRLAVRSSYRGQGIGALLMAEAERKLREKGCEEVSIFVNDADERLKEYYQKQGFIPTGSYRFMYKPLKL